MRTCYVFPFFFEQMSLIWILFSLSKAGGGDFFCDTDHCGNKCGINGAEDDEDYMDISKLSPRGGETI